MMDSVIDVAKYALPYRCTTIFHQSSLKAVTRELATPP